MMFDRAIFFKGYRKEFGRLSQAQVDGLNRLLDGLDVMGWSDPRWHAYALATDAWETGRKFQPVPEVGRGRGRKYGKPHPATGHVYYGRGDSQLTWFDNYRRASADPVIAKVIAEAVAELKLPAGSDLVSHPDLALHPRVSAIVMLRGMEIGLFTTKRLADYFNGSREDWLNARRIINGTDRAAKIAAIAKAFHAILIAAAVNRAPTVHVIATAQITQDVARELEARIRPTPISLPIDTLKPEGDPAMQPAANSNAEPTAKGAGAVNWINALGIVFQVLALVGLDVPADIQAKIASFIAFATGGATIAARSADKTAINAPIVSKTNLTGLLGIGAQLLPMLGILAPGAAPIIGMAGNAVSMIVRTFFTKTKR